MCVKRQGQRRPTSLVGARGPSHFLYPQPQPARVAAAASSPPQPPLSICPPCPSAREAPCIIHPPRPAESPPPHRPSPRTAAHAIFSRLPVPDLAASHSILAVLAPPLSGVHRLILLFTICTDVRCVTCVAHWTLPARCLPVRLPASLPAQRGQYLCGCQCAVP